MKLLGVLLALVWLHVFAPAGRSAEIHGQVLDAQGKAVAGAAVTVQQDGAANGLTPAITMQSAEDGTFNVPALAAGSYLIRVQKTGFAEQRQGPLEVNAGGPDVEVKIRLAASAEAETVRGAEERNPNDFILRLDNNAILNEMIRTGVNGRFVTEFRADRNLYGEQFGYPLRTFEWAAAGRPLSAFHGSLFEFHQNHSLNARPYFQFGPLLASRRNQYGFSVSGPLIREKAFFSFAWGQVKDTGFVNGNVQVPLANERAPRTSDPELRGLISALLKAYPYSAPNLPHISPRHLNTNAFRKIDSTAFSIHLDGTVHSGDRWVFDQQYQDTKEDPFELVIGQNPATSTKPQSLRFSYTRNFSPSTVGQISANYDRLTALLLPTERYQDLFRSLGLSEVPDFDLGDEISNIGLPGQGIPRRRYENHYFLSPQVTNTHGRHTVSAGFIIKHLWDSDQRTSNGRGTYTFNSEFLICDANTQIVIASSCPGAMRTATAVENFLLGRPSRLALSVGNQYRGYRNWEHGAWYYDRFRLRPNLTLNLGLRYEAITAPYDVSHRFEFQHDTDANNFGPQFGFAWNSGVADMVVRGGYGVHFGGLTLATWNRQAGNPPLVNSFSSGAPDLREISEISSLQPQPGRISGLGSLDAAAAVPYSHIYNLAIERELPAAMLVRVGYQGSRTIKLFTGLSLNRAVPDPRPECNIPIANRACNTTSDAESRRPNKQVRRIYNIVNGSQGYYDALLLTWSKRRSRGLAFEARYNFAKVIDTAIADFADTGNGGDVSQTEIVIPDLKAVSSFDTPHSLTLTYSYEIPALENFLAAVPSWVSRVFSKWTVSGTTTFRSGTPFSVYTGADGPGRGNIDTEGSDRPNLLDPTILGASFDNPDTSQKLMGAVGCKEVSPANTVPYFQCPAYDTNIAVGGSGNIGFRTFRKDGSNNWNLALGRNFVLTRSEQQIQFRAEFYNLVNHAQFSAPGTTVTSPTFGQITNTVNKGRVTQVSLRLVF